MVFKLFGAAAIVAACVALSGNSGRFFLPQDEKDAGKKMTQDELTKLKAAAEPGEQHRQIAKLAGTWKQEMVNTAEGMTSSGTITYRPVLGGRFILGESKSVMKHAGTDGRSDGKMNGNGDGAAMEQPWEGFQLIGYDNATKKHVTTYSSTMGTGICFLEGTADPSGKVITYEGTMKDAITPQGRPFKVVVNCESDDKTVVELWDSKGGKPLAKSCVITETRQN